jgi:hypothetical protein
MTTLAFAHIDPTTLFSTHRQSPDTTYAHTARLVHHSRRIDLYVSHEALAELVEEVTNVPTTWMDGLDLSGWLEGEECDREAVLSYLDEAYPYGIIAIIVNDVVVGWDEPTLEEIG